MRRGWVASRIGSPARPLARASARARSPAPARTIRTLNAFATEAGIFCAPVSGFSHFRTARIVGDFSGLSARSDPEALTSPATIFFRGRGHCSDFLDGDSALSLFDNFIGAATDSVSLDCCLLDGERTSIPLHSVAQPGCARIAGFGVRAGFVRVLRKSTTCRKCRPGLCC